MDKKFFAEQMKRLATYCQRELTKEHMREYYEVFKNESDATFGKVITNAIRNSNGLPNGFPSPSKLYEYLSDTKPKEPYREFKKEKHQDTPLEKELRKLMAQRLFKEITTDHYCERLRELAQKYNKDFLIKIAEQAQNYASEMANN